MLILCLLVLLLLVALNFHFAAVCSWLLLHGWFKHAHTAPLQRWPVGAGGKHNGKLRGAMRCECASFVVAVLVCSLFIVCCLFVDYWCPATSTSPYANACPQYSSSLVGSGAQTNCVCFPGFSGVCVAAFLSHLPVLQVRWAVLATVCQIISSGCALFSRSRVCSLFMQISTSASTPPCVARPLRASIHLGHTTVSPTFFLVRFVLSIPYSLSFLLRRFLDSNNRCVMLCCLGASLLYGVGKFQHGVLLLNRTTGGEVRVSVSHVASFVSLQIISFNVDLGRNMTSLKQAYLGLCCCFCCRSALLLCF